MIRALHGVGANLDTGRHDFPIIAAARRNNVECIETLAELGANMDIVSHEQCDADEVADEGNRAMGREDTALLLAARAAHIGAIKTLLLRGASNPLAETWLAGLGSSHQAELSDWLVETLSDPRAAISGADSVGPKRKCVVCARNCPPKKSKCRCKLVYFCSTDCQRVMWTGGHKAVCERHMRILSQLQEVEKALGSDNLPKAADAGAAEAAPGADGGESTSAPTAASVGAAAASEECQDQQPLTGLHESTGPESSNVDNTPADPTAPTVPTPSTMDPRIETLVAMVSTFGSAYLFHMRPPLGPQTQASSGSLRPTFLRVLTRTPRLWRCRIWRAMISRRLWSGASRTDRWSHRHPRGQNLQQPTKRH